MESVVQTDSKTDVTLATKRVIPFLESHTEIDFAQNSVVDAKSHSQRCDIRKYLGRVGRSGLCGGDIVGAVAPTPPRTRTAAAPDGAPPRRIE